MIFGEVEAVEVTVSGDASYMSDGSLVSSFTRKCRKCSIASSQFYEIERTDVLESAAIFESPAQV